MCDEALIEHFGRQELPAATADRPLVTFAIFSFNQESYIREAIEGAFTQTYSPLEIILTDDCSTDGTGALLSQMAAAYDGPHKIIVRRGTRNVGTLAHVLQAARLASGELFVVAAGDDISLPDRIARIAKLMAGQRAAAFSSDEIEIDRHGNRSPIAARLVAERDALHHIDKAWIHGATAAYRRGFLLKFPIPHHPVLYEDLVFRTVLGLSGGEAIRSSDCLILYRQHEENVYNRATAPDPQAEWAYRLKNWQRLAASYRYMLRHAPTVIRRSGVSPVRLGKSLLRMRGLVMPLIYFSILARIETAGPSARMVLRLVAAAIDRPGNDARRTASNALSHTRPPRFTPQRSA